MDRRMRFVAAPHTVDTDDIYLYVPRCLVLNPPALLLMLLLVTKVLLFAQLASGNSAIRSKRLDNRIWMATISCIM